MKTVIEFKGVTKIYGERKATDGLSFSVAEGEIFGLLGPNGAGKTTAVQQIIGRARPQMGTISICGFDPIKDWKEVRSRIGIVPQESALYEDLTGYQNLEFQTALYKLKDHNGKPMKSAQVKKRIREILELVDLSTRARDLVSHYSGGMKRRLAIGRALIHNPAILLLDEPTLGVDVQGTHKIWEYIENLSKERKTIVITTNAMAEAERLCRRLLIIDHGREIAQGLPEELKGNVKKEEKESRGPSLDDVFLHYTGRSLRDK